MSMLYPTLPYCSDYEKLVIQASKAWKLRNYRRCQVNANSIIMQIANEFSEEPWCKYDCNAHQPDWDFVLKRCFKPWHSEADWRDICVLCKVFWQDWNNLPVDPGASWFDPAVKHFPQKVKASHAKWHFWQFGIFPRLNQQQSGPATQLSTEALHSGALQVISNKKKLLRTSLGFYFLKYVSVFSAGQVWARGTDVRCGGT